MADALDSGSSIHFGCMGSTPFLSTILFRPPVWANFTHAPSFVFFAKILQSKPECKTTIRNLLETFYLKNSNKFATFCLYVKWTYGSYFAWIFRLELHN